MRVLVTGGCGFIGSHFVRRLVAGGDEVVVLDKLTYSGRRENLDGVGCELHVGDIADPEAVERAAAGCEAIVNFAAETHVDRSILEAGDFIRTDVYGPHVLLEHVRTAGGRLVHVSTDEAYGDDAAVTRGANTYGPNQHPEKLIPLFVTNALDGEPLPVYGDGRQRREWLHVDDHCAAVEAVMEKGEPGTVYNVGAG